MNIMPTNSTLTQLDAICDFIPGVSIVSNLVDLFLKYTYKNSPANQNNIYLNHLSRKQTNLCIALIVFPVIGNLAYYAACCDYERRGATSIDPMYEPDIGSRMLIQLDAICAFIPIISNISNIVNIILKHVYKWTQPNPQEPIPQERNLYWWHIINKPTSTCVFFAFVPVISNLLLYCTLDKKNHTFFHLNYSKEVPPLILMDQ